MGRIEIDDLEQDEEISEEEMQSVMGGALLGRRERQFGEGSLWPKQYDPLGGGSNDFIKIDL